MCSIASLSFAASRRAFLLALAEAGAFCWAMVSPTHSAAPCTSSIFAADAAPTRALGDMRELARLLPHLRARVGAASAAKMLLVQGAAECVGDIMAQQNAPASAKAKRKAQREAAKLPDAMEHMGFPVTQKTEDEEDGACTDDDRSGAWESDWPDDELWTGLACPRSAEMHPDLLAARHTRRANPTAEPKLRMFTDGQERTQALQQRERPGTLAAPVLLRPACSLWTYSESSAPGAVAQLAARQPAQHRECGALAQLKQQHGSDVVHALVVVHVAVAPAARAHGRR